MKLGIMQPYFFPYIGYWQLMNAVDQYVVYDDVNYKKGSWVNRNRILMPKKPEGWGYINLNLDHASPYKKFNEINVLQEQQYRDTFFSILWDTYRKAPYYSQVISLLKKIMTQEEVTLSKFLKYSFEVINSYLGIETKLILSSDIPKNNELRLEKKVIEICKILGADQYYSAMGGWDLYSKEEFAQQGIEFIFLKAKDTIQYPQFSSNFIPNLSIIDVMMFNDVLAIRKMLLEYELL